MKKTYLRRVTTKSTLDWVMRKIENEHKGCPIYPPKLEQDKETIKRWFEKNGWYKEEPIKDPLAQICMVGVCEREAISRDAHLMAMGHYFKLFETIQDQKLVLWVVVR